MVTYTLLCLCWYFIFWPCYFSHFWNSAENFYFFSCKTSFISFAELNISPAISPQQDQFSISCFRRNTYFYSPQSFCFFVQFYFMSCMCYLFEDFSWSSTFWTNYFFVCENICICWQILFHFLNRYLCRSSALRHVKSFCQLSYFLHPATPSMNFSFQRLLQRMVLPPHSICTKGKEYLFDL